MIIFESILTIWESSLVFEAAEAVLKMGSSLKPNHLNQVLAFPNLWNALFLKEII